MLTPSFGYGRFIRDAVESVLQQRGVAVEHVVWDGGSRDETVSVLESFGGAISWRSEPDDGQSDALNRALELCHGEWVAWLNADEFYLPDALKHLLAAAEGTGADVVYGDVALVDVDGRFLRLVPQHRFHRFLLRSYGPFIKSCTVLMRRESLLENRWHPLLRRVMDWDLYLALDKAGAAFAHIKEPVAAFRVHPDQVTANPAAPELADYRLVYERHGVRVGTRRATYISGRAIHQSLKLAEGAYRREHRARRFRGADLRWFRTKEAAHAARSLVSACRSSK